MFRSHQIEQIICLANDMSYPLIVAIDGLAGAGKSTLAKQLVAQMPNASCVNIDDFYRPIHFDQVIKLGSYELIESFFDWRRLKDHLLIPAGKSLCSVYRKYDWDSDELSDKIEIPANDVLIVEGVFALLPALRAFYQFKIYVDTPKSQRVTRIASRKYPDSNWIDPWILAEEWYLKIFEPQHHADIVINGSL